MAVTERHIETRTRGVNELAAAKTKVRGRWRSCGRNPLTAVMTGFGLGLGFGLAVTLLFTRRERSWYEQNIAGSLQNLPERLRHVPDSIGSYVPTAWKRW